MLNGTNKGFLTGSSICYANHWIKPVSLIFLFAPVLVIPGQKEKAAKWYQKGILELQKGIAIKITGEGNLLIIFPNIFI